VYNFAKCLLGLGGLPLMQKLRPAVMERSQVLGAERDGPAIPFLSLLKRHGLLSTEQKHGLRILHSHSIVAGGLEEIS
jgi:hypothetical protein